MKKSTLMRIGISIIIIIFIFYKIGLAPVVESLKSFKPQYLLICIAVILLEQLFTTINIKVLLSKLKKKTPFLDLLKYQLKSYSLGMILPGKLGEFSLAYFLKKEGITLGEGLAISLLILLSSFVSLVILSFFGFLVFYSFEIAVLITLLSLFFVVFVTFIIFSNRLRKFIRKHILRKYESHFKGFSNYFMSIVKHHYALLVLLLLLNFIRWVIASSSLYFLFLGFGVQVNFLYIYLFSALISIISMIPISFSGLGVKEVTAIYIYSIIGISSPVVFSSYIISNVIRYALVGIIMLFFVNTELHDAHEQFK